MMLGGARELAVLAGLLLVSSSAQAAEPGSGAAIVRFELSLQAGARGPEEGSLHLWPQTSGGSPLVLPTGPGQPLITKLPAGSTWELRVESAADARRTIEINLIEVEGKLSLGDHPLAARIWFGGRHGAQSVALTSDEEGELRGVLPRPGRWRVEAAAQDPKVETDTWVDVNPNAKGKARVEIEIPDTRLFGRALGENGEPRPGAAVDLSTSQADRRERADDKGAFELRGFAPGSITLRAEAFSPEGRLASETLSLSVRDGAAAGPVDLQLQRTRSLTGRVISPLGPVAGATISAAVETAVLFLGSYGRTGLEGEFSIEVPAKAESARVVVSPPGFGLKAFRVATDGSPTVLEVAAEVGELEIHSPYSSDEIAGRLVLYIFQDGIPLATGDLMRWTLAHGHKFTNAERTTLHASNLAPGEYSACLLPRAVGNLAGGAELSRTSCASGTLAPGQTLRLELSESASLREP